MTRAGRLSPLAEGAVLALAAFAARAAFLAAASSATGVEWRDLALRYDGHVYLQVAKTFPRLYASESGPSMTTWFSLYPALIRLAGVEDRPGLAAAASAVVARTPRAA